MSGSSKRRIVKRAVMLILLSAVSLAAWLGPALLNQPSFVDIALVLAWLIVMVLLLLDSYRRERKRERFLTTFYIDTAQQRVFNPALGLVTYPNGGVLIDMMAVALVNGKDQGIVQPPADFVPDRVVETTRFAFVRDDRLDASHPVSKADDVTIYRWEGVISDLGRGGSKPFRSPFDLEDVFNPLAPQPRRKESGCSVPATLMV